MKMPPIPGGNPATVLRLQTGREEHIEHRAAKGLGEARNRFLSDITSTGVVTRAEGLGRWLNLVRRECAIVENDIAQRVFPGLEQFRQTRIESTGGMAGTDVS
jgi:hypothetical protein